MAEDAVGNGDVTSADDVGPRTITISGGGPYGFRLTEEDSGHLVVGKLRKRGRADDAGLREGDVLLTVNGRSCHGLNCSQTMDLIDSSGSQNLVLRVQRGGGNSATVTSSSTSTERITSTSSSTSITRHHSSAQERAGQTVYVSPAEPVQVAVEPLTVQRSPGQIRQQPSSSGPSSSSHSTARRDGSGVFTVSAPSNVDVQRDSTSGTFTLTFGGYAPQQSNDLTSSNVQSQGQGQGPPGQMPVKWQPSITPLQSKSTDSQSTPAFVSGGQVDSSAHGSRPPQLSRILQESKDLECPDTPSSPQGKSAKKVFIDSQFYDDPEHKYPTVEEQIAMARRVAQSVLAPDNANSRGYKMFVRRKERSIRWEAGFNPEENVQNDNENNVDQQMSPTKPPPTLTSFVFAPKLPTGEKIVDPEKLDALSHEELEKVLLYEKKSTHTAVAPQVCFNLADDLRNMKGKGGRLFAKRQAKSESWAVGGGADGDEPENTGETEPDASVLTSTAELRLAAARQESSSVIGEQPSGPATKCEAMPVNRLKQMVELPRAAMSPWEAAATFGTVDPAFQHLESSPVVRRENASGAAGSGTGGRMKSWSGNPDAAAALASAMTSSMHARDSKTGGSYQPVKFTVPSATTSGTGTVGDAT